nr:zinc finger protein 1 homolog [Lytechinus pictus]
MDNSNPAVITVKQEPEELQNQDEDQGWLVAVEQPEANQPQDKSRKVTVERAGNACGALPDDQNPLDSCAGGLPATGPNCSSRIPSGCIPSEPPGMEATDTRSARFQESDVGSQQQDCPLTQQGMLSTNCDKSIDQIPSTVKNEGSCRVIPGQQHHDGSGTGVSSVYSGVLSRRDGREMSSLERRYFYGSEDCTVDQEMIGSLNASRHKLDVNSSNLGYEMVLASQTVRLESKTAASGTMIHESGVAIRCQEDLPPQGNKETDAFEGTSAAASIDEEAKVVQEQEGKVEDKPSQCKICHKFFLHVKVHMRVHTSNRPFKCSFCDKGFIEKRHLDNHMRSHTGEKPFKCPVCAKAFSRETHLTYHLRTHTGIKPFSCETCGRSFGRKGDLTVHMRIHTGERPFPCKLCDKTFGTQSNLTLHMRSHTGERPYECTACPKTFKSKSDLIKHVRVHTGEKPFKCKVCDRYFRATSDLKRHMRGHTNEKPYKCDVCLKEFSSDCYLPKHACTGAPKIKNVTTDQTEPKS